MMDELGAPASELLRIRFVSPLSLLIDPVLIILNHLQLALRLQAAVPTLSLPAAYAHIAAAEAAASDQLTVELLLGVAFVESRFDPTTVSRVQGHTRKTGRYPSTDVPAHLDPRASLFCGSLQTFASSWAACLLMRDLRTAYAAGAAELRQWLRDRRVRGDIRHALAGHGCGNYGVVAGQCNGYPGRVLSMARQFRVALGHPRSRARGTARST
jgi:hypothetical protein